MTSGGEGGFAEFERGWSQGRQFRRLTRPGKRASTRSCNSFMRGVNHSVLVASSETSTPISGPPRTSRRGSTPVLKPGVVSTGVATGLPVVKSKRRSSV